MHWKYFQKTDLDFLKLSYNKQTVVTEIISLNERRKSIQKDIVLLSSANNICKNCVTSCCRGNYNHFTVVDYIIRIFSDKPVIEFAPTQPKPPTYLKLIRERIRKPSASDGSSRSTMAHLSKCPNLTEKGCAFAPEDRPIRCVLYTCSSFRKSIPEKDLEKLGHLSEELCLISKDVFVKFNR
jgi:hypothetical protein